MSKTAKIFTTGRSQAVRLPKAFRFEGKEVFIHKEGNRVILSEKPESWDDFFNSPVQVSADFMENRVDLPPQERELF
ncbi:MAG: antitoxin [Methylococcales bacterium]|nr:antitoxin [Methylococcales bacterium]